MKTTEIKLPPTEWAAFVKSRIHSRRFRSMSFEAFERFDPVYADIYWIAGAQRVWRVVADWSEGY